MRKLLRNRAGILCKKEEQMNIFANEIEYGLEITTFPTPKVNVSGQNNYSYDKQKQGVNWPLHLNTINLHTCQVRAGKCNASSGYM